MSPRDRWLLLLAFVLMIVVDLLAHAVSPGLWFISFWATLVGWWIFRQYLLRQAKMRGGNGLDEKATP